MDKKEFCFFTLNDFSLSDGGTVRMKGMIEALSHKGCDITLISNSIDINQFPQTVKHIFINYHLGKNERRKIQFLFAILPSILTKILLRKIYCHLHRIFTENLLSQKEIIFFEYFDNSLAFFCKKCGIIKNCIIDIHGIAPLEFWYKNPTNVKDKLIKYTKFIISKILDHKVYKNIDGIILISQAMKNYFVNEYPFLKGKRIYIVPDGISRSLLEQDIDIDLVNSLKKEFNIDNETKIILFAGTFKNLAGVPDLVQAFIKVRNNFNNLKLMLIGIGEDYDVIVRLIEKNRIENEVILTGMIDYNKLKSYQYLADIIVCPDKWHPLSDMIIHIRYFDSIASGKIVIGGDFSAIREINDDERLSLFFKPSSIPDLVYKIEYALNNLEILSEKYNGNIDFISRRFSYDSFIEKSRLLNA